MNGRIKVYQLADQSEVWNADGDKCEVDLEYFAELIVKECAENFTKVWYEQGLDIRGAELDKFMKRFEEIFRS